MSRQTRVEHRIVNQSQSVTEMELLDAILECGEILKKINERCAKKKYDN